MVQCVMNGNISEENAHDDSDVIQQENNYGNILTISY
jgi:hypothetical protein